MTPVQVKPIPRDENFERMDKNSMTYRNQQHKRMCILCLNQATQILSFQMDGCTKVERYCDSCASKILQLVNNNQSTSGI
jgi:hypothetical protein